MGRFYLLVARVGLFRFAPFTALIALRPAHPRVPFACSQTNLSLVLIRPPYKKTSHNGTFLFVGSEGRIRTNDTRIMIPLL